jgi:hypothetical protein
MKERPILFSAPMVRALLAGTKTQTRRVSGLDVINAEPDRFEFLGLTSGPGEPHYAFHDKRSGAQTLVRCRSGKPGDRLWVREAFCPICPQDPSYNGGRPIAYDYRATYTHGDRLGDVLGIKKRWTPSIHMPRWASRITLGITGVRVERLQAISEKDAAAEGCERLDSERYEPDWSLCPTCGGTRLYTAFNPATGGALPDTDCAKCDTYAKRFRHLWERIKGAESWAANPYVWVVEFKRITGEQG